MERLLDFIRKKNTDKDFTRKKRLVDIRQKEEMVIVFLSSFHTFS